jgi:hypothetical protein
LGGGGKVNDALEQQLGLAAAEKKNLYSLAVLIPAVNVVYKINSNETTSLDQRKFSME